MRYYYLLAPLAALALSLPACNREPAPAAPPHDPPAPATVPSTRPAAIPPAPRYLADMGPTIAQTFTDGDWGFGGHGSIGNLERTPISVHNKLYPNGLGTHPLSNGFARVLYTLDRKFTRLTGKAALDDTAAACTTGLVFRINDDTHELWRSAPLSPTSPPVEFSVDVSSSIRIEFIVDCPGPNNAAHAVWLDPALTPVP